MATIASGGISSKLPTRWRPWWRRTRARSVRRRRRSREHEQPEQGRAGAVEGQAEGEEGSEAQRGGRPRPRNHITESMTMNRTGAGWRPGPRASPARRPGRPVAPALGRGPQDGVQRDDGRLLFRWCEPFDLRCRRECPFCPPCDGSYRTSVSLAWEVGSGKVRQVTRRTVRRESQTARRAAPGRTRVAERRRAPSDAGGGHRTLVLAETTGEPLAARRSEAEGAGE